MSQKTYFLAEIKQKEENKIQKTKIEWVKSPDGSKGMSWNPITGCLNGCEYCYARQLANGRLRARYMANDNIATTLTGKDLVELHRAYCNPFYPRFWPEKLQELLTRNSIVSAHQPKPRGIFVCSMSDLFGIGVPEEWTRQIIQAITDNAYDRFYLLTKQPQNLPSWSPFPSNCGVGVTATNQQQHNEAVVVLSGIKAGFKFISHEPLLGHISLHSPYSPADAYDWDIIGSQTKPYRPPAISDVREIVEACDKASLPVFLKNSLKPLIQEAGMCKAEWAAREWVQCKYPVLRQEMPDVK